MKKNIPIPFISECNKSKTGAAIAYDEFSDHGGIAGLKYLLVVMYLRKHLQTFGEVKMSFSELADECGYSTKTHNQFSYDDFRDVLQYDIIDKGYATTNVDVLTIGARKQFLIFLTEDKNLFYREDRYVFFSITEFEKITSLNKKVNRSVLAGVYLIIKKYITADESNIHGSRLSYPSKRSIANSLDLTMSTVESAIKTLVDLHMIYVVNDLYVQIKKGATVYIPTRSVFALREKDLDIATCISELTTFYKQREVLRKSDIPAEQRRFLKNGGTN